MNATSNVQAKEAILNEFASKVYLPYVVMAVILMLLAVWIVRSSLPELKAAEANVQPAGGAAPKEKTTSFQFPHLWLGVLCLFLYVGAEVMAGDAIGTYGKGFDILTSETKYYTLVYVRRPAGGVIS